MAYALFIRVVLLTGSSDFSCHMSLVFTYPLSDITWLFLFLSDCSECVSTDGKALVKLVSPAELLKARDEKRAQAEAKAARKAAAVEAERQKRIAVLEKGRVPPQELFKPPNVPEDTYGSWDENGIPLTDAEGKELSKSAGKKVQKEWTLQKKRHEEFLEWQKQQQQ